MSGDSSSCLQAVYRFSSPVAGPSGGGTQILCLAACSLDSWAAPGPPGFLATLSYCHFSVCSQLASGAKSAIAFFDGHTAFARRTHGGVPSPYERKRGPLKGPRGPLKGSPGSLKGPRGPLKGPRGPFQGPRGPFRGPRGLFKGSGVL